MIRKLFPLLLLATLLAACGTENTPSGQPTASPTASIQTGDPTEYYRQGLNLLLTSPEQAAEPLALAAEMDSTFSAQVSRLEAALRQVGAVDDLAYQHTIIGQALASVGEWTLAETALEQAVDEDPEYAEAWAYLGEVRQQTGYGDPLEALETALELNPDSYAANLFTSMYWKRNDQPERALDYLYTALEQDASNLSLQEDLAHTLVLAGQVEEGFQVIQTLLETDPENPEIWQMLARLSIENSVQISEVGLPAARQARVLEPDNPEATLLLGRAYMLDNDSLLAERFFIQAAAQAPDQAAPHFYLGLLYLNQEKFQSAQTQLKQTLQLAETSGESAIAAQASQILSQYYP